MNKKSVHIFVLCLIFILVIELVIEIIIYKRGNEIKDNILFYRQYPEVGQDNVYKIVDINKAIHILQNDTGIVMFGFPSCKWCQKFVVVLNEAAKEYDIENIYYVDIKYDRKNNTQQYQQLINIIGQYLGEDKSLTVPDVYFVKGGNILGHNNETSAFTEETVEEYYTEENRSNLKQNLIKYIKMVQPASCNDSEKEC